MGGSCEKAGSLICAHDGVVLEPAILEVGWRRGV